MNFIDWFIGRDIGLVDSLHCIPDTLHTVHDRVQTALHPTASERCSNPRPCKLVLTEVVLMWEGVIGIFKKASVIKQIKTSSFMTYTQEAIQVECKQWMIVTLKMWQE